MIRRNSKATGGWRALATWLAVLGLAYAPCAHAHGATLIVSRDFDERPRLVVNGSNQYRDGSTCIELLKGDGQFEAFWVTDAPGFSTLKRDGVSRAGQRLLHGHRLGLKLVHAERGYQMLEPSTWRVVLGRNGDVYEFPRDVRGDFVIQMISRSNHEGTVRAKFQFVDLARIHHPSKPFTLCFRTATARDTNALPRPIVVPATYRGAVADLRPRIHQAGSAIAAGQVHQVNDDALAIRMLVEALPTLARAADSGVPVEGRAVVDSASTAALGVAGDLHLAADLGDPIAAREGLDRLRVPLAAFERYVALKYTCPMGCENGKTYDAPGHCPVCGMKLADSRAHQDHTPKHGGVFMMSPDFGHHLEAVLESDREARVYFYDEFTEPIAADSIQARLEWVAPVAGAGPALTLRRGPSPECLVATLPPGLPYPLHVSLVVDFRDGNGEQSFDVQLVRARAATSAP